MIIFLSTGPVISTLLSLRLFGTLLIDQSDLLISSVLGSKDGSLPESTID